MNDRRSGYFYNAKSIRCEIVNSDANIGLAIRRSADFEMVTHFALDELLMLLGVLV